jgi:hypothetical protein
LCDVDRDARCFACGEALSTAAVNRPQINHSVEQETTQDRSASRLVLAVIGVLGLVAFSSSLRLGPWILVPLTILVVSVAGGVLIGRQSVGRSVLFALSTLGGMVLIMAALGFGLVVLVFIVCAAGGFRIAG